MERARWAEHDPEGEVKDRALSRPDQEEEREATVLV